MKRLARYLLWALLLFLLILISAIGFLISTQTGLNALLTLAERVLPGDLTYDRIQGRLIGPLELAEFHYEHGDLVIDIASAEFDWQPSALLGANLHIDRLKADGIVVHLPEAAPEEKPEPQPFALTDIQLPIGLEVDDVAITDIRIHPQGAAQPLVIDGVWLRVHTEDNTLVLENLEAKAPQGDIATSGRLTPTGAYPLELQLEWDLRLPDYSPLSGQGTVAGNLQETLTINHRVSGMVSADLQGDVRQVLEKPDWDASLDLNIADLGRFSPELADSGLSAQLQSQGTLEDFQASGELATQLPEVGAVDADFSVTGSAQAIQVERLALRASDSPMALTAQGNVDLASQKVAATGQWQSLAWPLVGEPQIQSPDGEFSLQGSLQDYRLQLETAVVTPQTGRLALDVQANGTDQAIQLSKLSITQPNDQLALNMKARVALTDLAFAADGQWQSLTWPLQGEPQVASPQGNLTLKGTPQDYRLQLKADLTSTQSGPLKALIEAAGTDQSIQISTLSLRATEGPLALTAQGRLGFADLNFNASGEWQALSWPLVGTPQVESPQGTFKASGKIEDYDFKLDTIVQGQDIPRGSWSLDGEGSAEALQRLDIDGQILEGELQGQLSARWQPTISWQAQITGSGLNPGVQWPETPGKLALKLRTRGTLTETGPKAELNLEDLSGTLQGQTIQGTTRASILGQDLNIETLRFAAGNARLTASGSLTQRWDIRWDLSAPELQNLAPFIAGSVESSGQLGGPREQPRAEVQLAIQNLNYQDIDIQRLQGTASVDVSGATRSRLDFTGTGLRLAGQNWQDFTLQGSGTPADHSLETRLLGDLGRFGLALTGGLENDLWQGRLTQLSAQNTEVGDWALARPVALLASPSRANAEQLCLTSPPTQICLQGRWDAATGAQGQLSLDRLTMERFAALLPENVKLDTTLNGRATGGVRPDGTLTGQVNLDISPGSLRLVTDGAPVPFNLGGGSLRAEATGQTATATLQIDLGDTGQIQGDVRLTELTAQPRINGNINARIENLGLISAFVPQLQDTSGQAVANLDLSGGLPVPVIQGEIRLVDVATEVPEAGIRIEDVQLTAVSDSQGIIDFSGSAESGPGQIALTGRADPATSEFNLNVEGQEFQAVNTPDIRILISPDLAVRLEQQQLRIDGQVVVPQAFLSPPGGESGPNVVPVSQDVVYVGKDAEVTATGGLDIYAAIRVILGDDVRVQAFGFKGQLKGNLLVEQTPQLAPRGTGSVEVAAGNYRIYGQDLEIQRGRVLFTGGPIDNPGLDLRVAREKEDITVGAQVTGALRNPRLDLFSTPAMPDSSILSYLILGRAPGEASEAESALLLRGAAALGFGGSNAVTQRFSDAVGLDTLKFETNGDPTQEAALVLGKYLSPDLYVSYGVGLFEAVDTFRLRYTLTEQLTLESDASVEGSGADLIYTLER